MDGAHTDPSWLNGALKENNNNNNNNNNKKKKNMFPPH